MKRVLVTGAGGFLGRHCLRALQQRGFEVLGVSSQRRAADELGIGWHAADLRHGDQAADLIAATRPTHLLHLAWIAKPGEFWSSPENLRWLEAGLVLLRCFQEQQGQRVVVAGTCAEYDWAGGTCREAETPLRPQTVYGKCKHALSLYLDCLARQTGLSAAWGRLFFMYGPYAPPEKFPQGVLEALWRGTPALCTHGRQIRDFLHVQDAAEAIVALLDSPVSGAVNIASGIPLQLSEMAERLALRLGQASQLRLGALPARPDEPAAVVADVGRLREEVNWSPRFDLESGLDDLVQWWERRTAHDVKA